ncbi:uncharacterized protein LOC131536483 [Onychostoma macrolepis]|uniref:uncharacterized protein LOC131536483 n=1 Tax=Onychostoma macrolepis TaxID=369639 RepID=UPI00272AEC53|nr:uncharacterized protein LOC131536483 [Onychostoma macrolepis]XP_058625420.1 uncharacterized protein LOC131536483 [Onychostoma macrolepis]XP_058625421.1 uncharacterized protein LOC131536483 [Onychostoma macrolepis]XP_058625422.1 uncharacterized protein LOC131536483 [Onychostoma macrolepis]XP_058625423.1 uncharacterized protein LOC131536483 [Onychostoma macrolepis]
MGRSLEDHTRDFLDLACLTHFPDCSLCVFYISSLSERCKARLPANGPKEDFAACVEWVLENNGLFFSICLSEEDISSPTPEPETSQPSPRYTEPEPQISSDQVREPATSSVLNGVLVVYESLEGSPAHTPTTEGELHLVSRSYQEEHMDIFLMDLIDWFGEVLTCAPESPASPLVLSSPESPGSPLVPSSPESPASPLVPSSSCAAMCHLQQLSLRQSVPWCRRPLLHHGSSHHQLHRGLPSWLASGLPPDSSRSGLLPPSTPPWTYVLYSFCFCPFPIACPSPTPRPPPEPPPSLLFWTAFVCRGRTVLGRG